MPHPDVASQTEGLIFTSRKCADHPLLGCKRDHPLLVAQRHATKGLLPSKQVPSLKPYQAKLAGFVTVGNVRSPAGVFAAGHSLLSGL